MTNTTGYVYFAIKTEDKELDLEKFNSSLTIRPTEFNKMFENGRTPKCTKWEFSSGKLVNPYYFEEIEKLIEKLEPHKEEFNLLKSKYTDLYFVLEVVIFLGDESPGLNFSRRTLEFINDIGAEIDCDIYNHK